MPKDNVIAFPTKSISDRAAIERDIRIGLKENGMSLEAIELVITNMARFIEAINFDFTFSFCFSPDVASAAGEQLQEFSVALNERTKRFVLELISERVKREIYYLASTGVI